MGGRARRRDEPRSGTHSCFALRAECAMQATRARTRKHDANPIVRCIMAGTFNNAPYLERARGVCIVHPNPHVCVLCIRTTLAHIYGKIRFSHFPTTFELIRARHANEIHNLRNMHNIPVLCACACTINIRTYMYVQCNRYTRLCVYKSHRATRARAATYLHPNGWQQSALIRALIRVHLSHVCACSARAVLCASARVVCVNHHACLRASACGC